MLNCLHNETSSPKLTVLNLNKALTIYLYLYNIISCEFTFYTMGAIM